MQTGARAWAAVVVLGSTLVICGCYRTFIDLGDADGEGDSPIDAETVEVIEADADSVHDGGTEGSDDEVEGDACSGWYDSISALCWQDPPDETGRNRDDAASYCADLVLGGLDDWRLPTIGELRSLLRECPKTGPGGPCGIVDDCLERDCYTDECFGCVGVDPGADGTFLTSALHGLRVDHWRDYWSSSMRTDLVTGSWTVEFVFGRVDNYHGEAELSVRCVRPAP